VPITTSLYVPGNYQNKCSTIACLKTQQKYPLNS